MSEDVALLLHERLERAAQETIEGWLTEPADAGKAATVEDLLATILDLAEFPGRALQGVLRRLETDEVEDPQAAGLRLRGIYDTTLRLVDGVTELVRLDQAGGHTIEGAEKLTAAAASLRSARERFIQSWPWDDRPRPTFDPAVTAASREAVARGEVLTLEEFARELGRSADS